MAGLEPGHDDIYRAAQADFNVRGWQGRLRYTALTALFFSWRQNCLLRAGEPAPLLGSVPVPAASSQAGDLRSAAIAC